MQNLKFRMSKICSYFLVLIILGFIDVSRASIKFSVFEGKAPGEFVGNLNTKIAVVHPTPSKFHFNFSTGVIKSTVSLDREKKSSYTFTVVTLTGGTGNTHYTVEIKVKDVNDEFPLFSYWNKTVHISETYSVGHIYNLDLQVRDNDEGANSIHNNSVVIESGNVGSVFKINLKKHAKYYAVSLEFAKKLNWSVQHKYVLNISASDTGTPVKTSYMTLIIIVLDYNNCRPQFSRQSYLVDVSESVKQRTIVLNISTSDCDGGKNAEVTYKMNYDASYDKNRYFTIQQKNRIGYIVTNHDLDYETTKIYKLQVIASDKGTQPLQNKADITVHVRDENDNAPEIDTFLFQSIDEDAKVNSLVAKIKIHDKDSGENGKLNVSLDPMSIPVFSMVGNSQGIYHIYLKTKLDYEKKKTYHIIVTATDNGKPPKTSQKSGTLAVYDVNDNPPVFSQNNYTNDISESVKTGTAVLTVSATDIDTVSASNITYRILSTNYPSWFGINFTSGVIYATSVIDREQYNQVTLVIQAYDGKFSTNCTVVLNIIDSNDNAPQFSMPHYIMTVLENSNSGTFVGKVNASDADLTSRGHISFFLGNCTQNVFSINNTTGIITTVEELNREEIGAYNFSVIAHDEDGLQSIAMVTVMVDDVNDNRPFFKNNFYNLTVLESISVGTNLVRLEADDHDIGWNAQISYEIISGNDESTFALDKSNGQISLHKELDREKVDKYMLKFRAIDNGGLTSHKLAIVEILVKDVNDDPPVFQKDKYTFHVQENASIVMYVGAVMAKSYDQGSGGIISYFIMTHEAQQYFYINNSGAISTRTKLDHEVQSNYEFVVEARDLGTPPLFGYVNVTVVVIDINDNFPVWSDYNHCIKLFENHPLGDVFHVFNASDKDSGLNGKVTYSIVSEPDSVFHLNANTGYLSLNVGVDYEQVHMYQLIVNASDSGKPILWSLLNVNICIIDVNDNVPILHNSSVNVREDLAVNALIYTFHAVDKDSGDNGKVWYKFSESFPPNNFELSKDGNLTLKSPLDRETQDKYELYVLTGDFGYPIKTSTPAKLTIYVQDVNDETPVFTKQLSFFTTENEIAGTLIGKVKAKDNDLGKNSEIEYSLLNLTDNFEIDSRTGELRNVVELDREKSPTFRVLIQATDKGDPPKSSRTTACIYVQDVNDNAPQFTETSYYASVAENVMKGTKITQVKAVDSDEGRNGEVIYYLSTGNLQGGEEKFQINATTGVIYIITSLDREIKEFFVLSIVANDDGNPPKDSISRVFVTVLDVNDHKPEFKVKNDTIYISEKTPVGSIVYRANATDQDKDENGNIIYSIVKESGEQVFRINAKTGAVSLNKTLDYEHTKQYSLRIKASDNAKDSPKKSILRLYINILDSNDNGPIFDENPIFTHVFEGVDRGTKVYKPILARDKDSGINSRIVYSIESQTPKGAFKIDPFKAQLTTDVEIDREDVNEYRLVVKAVDQAADASEQKSNTVTVIILVSDVNDCIPVFTSRNESFIMEDEPVNYTVFYFTAEDKDLDHAGNVTFSIVEGNQHGIFYLDPYWGSLILKKPLDREKVDTYKLKIKASDQGSPPLSKTILFTLSVEDVNDNIPKFSNYIYKVDIPENNGSANVFKVQATDLDSGQLKYSLPPGFANDLFVINETSGQISVSSPLDREKTQVYKLAVYVQDNGYPLYTDSATVIINVADENDNVPHSLHDWYEVKIPENMPPGFVCSIVAQDSDAGINARLSYTIKEGDDFGYFEIDQNSGILSNVAPLDRELISEYKLAIEVKDSGHPYLSTTITVVVVVLDENDNNPKFRSREIDFHLPGGIKPGTAVGTVTATDDDEDCKTGITYSFGSEDQIPFALDSTSGLISTVNYLNASNIDTYTFLVNASDGSESGARFGSVKVNVFVDHVTGIPLRFTQVLHELNLDSQTKAGIKILQLQLQNDYLKPGDVEYVREGGQTVLSVGHTGGNVSFTQDPMPGAYLFSVRAILVRDRSMTAVCFVLVTVQRTVKRPRFSHLSYYAIINENDPPGTFVLTVKPYTPGNVTYQIVDGNEFDAFKIDANGKVIVKTSNALDYERSPSFEIDIKGDWGNLITNIAFTKLYITLRNLNDKAPVFRQNEFLSSVPESNFSSNIRFVTKLLAFNFENSQMAFGIVSGNNGNVFSLDLFTGDLYLQKPVNREDKNLYNLTVSISAGQLSSKCNVLVFITDINDNPVKLPGMINFTVLENTPLGSYVGHVNATDEDEYSVITYSFSGNTQRNGPFVIDRYTGVLSVVDAVDFETKPNLFSMDIFASDQKHESSTKIFVTLLDENDHKPLFEKSSYSVKRKERIPANTPLAQISASDKDQGENKRIVYNVTFNEEIGIEPITGIVFTKKELIYSKDFIDLIITAADHGSPKLSSQAPFRLQILDVNNNLPDFNATYDERIPEDIEVGTVVVRIKAINSESLSGNKRISFQIRDGDELKMFRIEERTGIIRVRRQLDREITDQYNLVVIAKDDRSSLDDPDVIKVRIKIDDVNDNAPIFQRNKYYVNGSMYETTIAEDIVPPRLVLRVLAIDKDIGRNSQIKYSISSGNNDGWFSMNDKGDLLLVKPVDRDVIPIHRLSVEATDQGTPPRPSDISVVIKVNDTNDNAPVFLQPRDLGVAENSPNGTQAGIIKATDSDFGENQNIFYSIVNGTGLGLFRIQKSTGNLTSVVEFDYEKKSSYTLVVKAQDQGKPPRFRVLSITVPIIGVDEYEPRFLRTSYHFVVSGNAKKGDIVGSVYANDSDSGLEGVVKYELDSPITLFAITNSSGEIYLTEDVEVFYVRKRNKRGTGTESSPTPDTHNLTISASSGQPGSKISRVTAEMLMNYTSVPPLPTEGDQSISETIQTLVIAISIVAVLAFVAFLLWLFVRCKRKEGTEAKKPGEDIALRTITLTTSSNSFDDKGLVNNRYEHVPTSASNSVASGSSSCENRSSDTGFDKLYLRNLHTKKQVGSHITDSGLPDTEVDISNDSDGEDSDTRSFDVRSDRTDRIIAHLESVESLHDFDDEGGREASAGLDVGNLLYAKLAEADAEEDDQNVDRPRVFNYEGRPDYTGSLSSILGSHEELRGNYNYFYAMNQGPQYQPLSEVFSEIGRLPNTSKENILGSPLTGVTDVSARTSMLSSASSLHNQHIDPESTYSSLPMTPNFTPAITPLVTRSPSLSPLTSEVVTPMVSPSQSRPSSMYVSRSRPSSSMIQLAERDVLDDFDDDVHV